MTAGLRQVVRPASRLEILRGALPATREEIQDAHPLVWPRSMAGRTMLRRDLEAAGARVVHGVFEFVGATRAPAKYECERCGTPTRDQDTRPLCGSCWALVRRATSAPAPGTYPLPQLAGDTFWCMPMRATIAGTFCLRRQDARRRTSAWDRPVHEGCGPAKRGAPSPCAQGRAVRAHVAVAPAPADVQANRLDAAARDPVPPLLRKTGLEPEVRHASE